MSTRAPVLFGCVAENDTKYLTQAVRLVQSLRWFGGSLADSDVIVGVVEGCRPNYRRVLEALGASVVILPRESDWHGPSNKLGFLRLPQLVHYEHVLLTDCDVVILDDIADALQPGVLRAKPADLATLGDTTLADLFQRAGLPAPTWRLRTSIDGIEMLPYCNSGVLLFHRDVLAAFGARWIALNDWMLTQRAALGPREFHCDQASFALALGEFGASFAPLPIELNFPGHLALERYASALHDCVPRVLHYHHRVDGRKGGLAPVGLAGVDAAVARFNTRLSQERRGDFSNALFWDMRYRFEPELGSGIGSRGEHALYKTALLRDFIADNAVTSLADFGCGDCASTGELDVRDYIGIDASAEVVERNRTRFPGRRFVLAEIVDADVSASHSLCFDVLIHQPTPRAYRDAVAAILQRTTRGGLINGFDHAPTLQSDIIFFHEPLCDTLAALGVRATKLGEYRETPIYFWEHARPTP